MSANGRFHLGTQLRRIVEAAKGIGRVTFTDDAGAEWVRVYSALSAGQSGLLGAITARAEAQVIRLATLYALLDNSSHIEVAHLKAGLAIWEYCEASAAYIFGDAVGDPVADEILRALRQAGEAGMTRTAIRDLFGRNRSGDRIGAALALLMGKGRAKGELKETGGRPVEIWFATKDGCHG
jgi:DNA replicative helicase MCM subunit Mcm2 (Cdc46/Mcm family)